MKSFLRILLAVCLIFLCNCEALKVQKKSYKHRGDDVYFMLSSGTLLFKQIFKEKLLKANKCINNNKIKIKLAGIILIKNGFLVFDKFTDKTLSDNVFKENKLCLDEIFSFEKKDYVSGYWDSDAYRNKIYKFRFEVELGSIIHGKIRSLDYDDIEENF